MNPQQSPDNEASVSSPPPRQQSRPLEPIPMRNLSLESLPAGSSPQSPHNAGSPLLPGSTAARLVQQRAFLTSSPSANSVVSAADTAYGGEGNEQTAEHDEAFVKPESEGGSDSGSSTAATEKDSKGSSKDRDLEIGMPKTKSIASSSDMDSQSVGEIVVPEENRKFRPGVTMFLIANSWLVHLVLVFTFTYLMTFYLPQFYVDDEMWNMSCYWKLGG